MNLALLVAAVLTIGVGTAHSYLGERYVIVRLFRRTDLPHLFGSDWFTRRVIRLAWHLTTVAWIGFGALLFAAARAAPQPVSPAAAGSIMSTTFLISAVVTLAASRGRHLAWLVFLAIGLAAWYGTR